MARVGRSGGAGASGVRAPVRSGAPRVVKCCGLAWPAVSDAGGTGLRTATLTDVNLVCRKRPSSAAGRQGPEGSRTLAAAGGAEAGASGPLVGGSPIPSSAPSATDPTPLRLPRGPRRDGGLTELPSAARGTPRRGRRRRGEERKKKKKLAGSELQTL